MTQEPTIKAKDLRIGMRIRFVGVWFYVDAIDKRDGKVKITLDDGYGFTVTSETTFVYREDTMSTTIAIYNDKYHTSLVENVGKFDSIDEAIYYRDNVLHANNTKLQTLEKGDDYTPVSGRSTLDSTQADYSQHKPVSRSAGRQESNVEAIGGVFKSCLTILAIALIVFFIFVFPNL